MTNPLFLPSGATGIAGTLLSNRPVTDGEPVTASVTNRLPVTNSVNTAYLLELFKRGMNNSGEFLWGVPIAPDVVIGDFVYFAGTEGRFAKGLARYVFRDGRHQESETSAVWGVVIRVRNQTGDLCTSGLCEFETDLAVYLTVPEPGLRFLSDRTPGEPVPDPVLPEKCLGCLVGVKSTGAVQFFVRPSLTGDSGRHRHESLELASVPAGTCHHSLPKTITSVQPQQPGWVPASHPMFAGKMPEDAKYGYNPIAFQTGCRWPLRFASNAGLRWQRCIHETDDPLLAAVPPELYRIDETTIWWLTDATHHLPWDSRLDYTGGEPAGLPADAYRFRMWLDFVNSGYGLTDGVVSSLRTAGGSGLTVTNYPFGGPAVTGDLLLDFALRFRLKETGDLRGHAVREINGTDVSTGPVVTGLKIDSRFLRVIRSDDSGDHLHSGVVVLGDPSGQIGQELPFEAVHLHGVEEAVEREAIGLAFPQTRVSSFLARIVVPFSETFSQFHLSLFFGILVTRSGNIAPDLLKLSYRIIAHPHQSNRITQAFPHPALEPLACDFQVQNSQYSTGYYTAQSEHFIVRPGDLVLVKVERSPPDNFNDRFILLRKSALLGYV
jgi:hypothetical protein